MPDQAKKAGAAQVRRAETPVAAAGAERDAWLLERCERRAILKVGDTTAMSWYVSL